MRVIWAAFLLTSIHPARAAHPTPIAITHVTVIDATGAPPRSDQTVIVTGDRITAITAAGQAPLPKGVQVIEAKGKFLIPGLWDMHGHLTDATEAAFPRLVANGIAGVRDMGGDLDRIDRWRSEIDRGARLGPRIVRAGPFVDGPKSGATNRLTVTTAAEARHAVDSLKLRGVDFIKVHNLLPREAFLALCDEARKAHLPVAVHLPRNLSSAEASDAGAASLEHIETLIESALYRQGATAKTWDEALAENLGSSGAATFARFVHNGTWYVPTLVAYYRGFVFWGGDPRKVAIRRGAFAKYMGLVADMHRAGVRMMAGSDFTEASVGVLPGADLHQELAFLVEAGFTPMEAIQAATINPATFLGQQDSLGTVEVGKRADLVLLSADPIDNINNTRTIDMIFLRGRAILIGELGAEWRQAKRIR